MTNNPKGHLHILGIAGHAMRGVALAAKSHGYTVSGTDEAAYGGTADWFESKSIPFWSLTDPSHLDGVDKLVLGGGVGADNAELVEAQRRKLPIISYPELVNDLLSTNNRIVVAGTHGKTTTTSLIAWVMESAGRNPDYLVGIKPNNFESSVRITGSNVAILEGDEYLSSQLDKSSKFTYYYPSVVIITSIEFDHPDMFNNIDDVKQRFIELVKTMPTDGKVFFWAGSSVAQEVVAHSSAPVESYGDAADWQTESVAFSPQGISFDLLHKGKRISNFTVPMYGRHNVFNAAAAAAVSIEQGISVQEVQTAFTSFKGATRRFEKVSGAGSKVVVIDDYAHHPTEVQTTIEAVKLHFPGRVIAVFRPHTYSRTLGLLNEYRECFAQADVAYVADIEGAREAHLEGKISSADIVTGATGNVTYEPDREKLMQRALETAQAGDVVLCMSVNGYDNFAQELSQRTKNQN